jgi:polysaccharide biosynthesis protein PslH
VRTFKTLFVAPQVPWPLDVGSKIRVHNLLRCYADVGPVTLVSFAQNEVEAQGTGEIERLAKRVCCFRFQPPAEGTGKRGVLQRAMQLTPRALSYFRCESLADKVGSLLADESFDILHVERLYMVENVRPVFAGRRRSGPPFRVLDVDDLESSRMKRMAGVEPWLAPLKYVHGLEWLKLRRAERQFLPQFDCALVCSEKDRLALQHVHPGLGVEVFANGAELDLGAPAERHEDGRTIVFLGAMDYQPNEDAVLFFAQQVLPLLKRRVPQVRFMVAGKSPSPRVRALHDGKTVLVTGYVQDKAALFCECTVFVVPIRIGGGTRIKILEAMAASIPVVSTTVGCEGIDVAPDQNITIADAPAEFAEGCARLLLDAAGRRALGRAGRRLVELRYGWEQIRKRYVQELQDRLAPSPGKV